MEAAVKTSKITRHGQELLLREHAADGRSSEAIYSPCEKYRYELTRTWNPNARKILFILLNPSTATETRNDPTVERCEQRARKLGYGSFRVCNIFAWRGTDPRHMRAEPSPVGEANDDFIVESCGWADEIVAAWGNHGEHLQRGAQVRNLLAECRKCIKILKLTGAGHPSHPLYISYAWPLQKWRIG